MMQIEYSGEILLIPILKQVIILYGTTYYLRKYSGDSNVDCCSNLIGNDTSGGIFTLYGFVLIRVNDTESKYVRVYTFEDLSSSSSSSSIDSSSSSSSTEGP